ncbi:hypothetical protein FGO68_gene8821 [Halteria grandinella]|uniref:Uncharacterized protein n=1 Tax=Halteria grandinella TaxID=5974 RepID=A0A8J8NWH8_HALGN|nr:hypothetical protein FGO68_gene8821 [Halteria grandinella]
MLTYKGPNSFYYLDTQFSLKQLSTMPIVNWSKLTDIHWEHPVKKKTEMRLKWTKCIQVNERWVYFIGGEIEGMDKASAFCRRLDIKGRVMQIREWMKGPRLCFGITCIRDSIYVMGGNNGAFESLRSCEEYSISQDRWNAFPSLPQAINGATAIKFEERYIYLIGGQSEDEDSFWLTHILRIDIHAPKLSWESIQICEDYFIESCQQPGIIPLSDSDHEFLLLGGSGNIMTTIVPGLLNHQFIVNVKKQTLESVEGKKPAEDRFYYNQYFKMDGDYQYGLVGRHALHIIEAKEKRCTGSYLSFGYVKTTD